MSDILDALGLLLMVAGVFLALILFAMVIVGIIWLVARMFGKRLNYWEWVAYSLKPRVRTDEDYGVNPASGIPMAGLGIDMGGNTLGDSGKKRH